MLKFSLQDLSKVKLVFFLDQDSNFFEPVSVQKMQIKFQFIGS